VDIENRQIQASSGLKSRHQAGEGRQAAAGKLWIAPYSRETSGESAAPAGGAVRVPHCGAAARGMGSYFHVRTTRVSKGDAWVSGDRQTTSVA